MMRHSCRERQLVPFIAQLISISGDCTLWYLQTSAIYSAGLSIRMLVRYMLERRVFGLFPSHRDIRPLLKMLFMPEADLSEWNGWGQVATRRGRVSGGERGRWGQVVRCFYITERFSALQKD